jgi:hypothetical protein
MMTIIIQYRTTDIVLASYLRVKGCTMTGIEKQGQRGTFVFEDVDEALITAYDLGTAKVEPLSFNNMVKTLTTAVRRMV